MLSALEAVDYVTLFDELTPVEILSEIKPNVYCNGSDWGKNCIERNVIEKNGGKVHVLKKRIFSTSSLVESIIKTRAVPEVKAVFLDRDGTINVNHENYVKEISDFKFLPGAISAIKQLSKTDYKIIVITNQSGIGRKVITENKLKEIHRWMVGQLKKHGARIDGIYYCSHHPDNGCSCRKPEPGMFLRAMKDFNINLSKSWMVGDDKKDIIAARRANIRAIKIGEKLPKELKLEANHYVKNLLEAVTIILKK
ncbi:MAG: D-glycero-beta-D-manno-heptose 1,7-bisphosphate 7-phosphatase [Candidatus Staskawiczbacteria bacterium]|nr:D-glycero-beta-D-manno-heptose 1,7-bisphosphate 7-phosphatase [Candidatus Staskawiczbacteria bacterium]